jgi:thioredoxin 1
MIAYITELNPENSKTFSESKGLVLVDIWAPWCGPCKVISPIIDELSSIYGDPTTSEDKKVKFGKLNADSNQDYVGELGIRSIPTIILYKNGEEIERSIGQTTKQKLTEMLEKHLN